METLQEGRNPVFALEMIQTLARVFHEAGVSTVAIQYSPWR